MPEPSVSAGAEPSAEAIEAVVVERFANAMGWSPRTRANQRKRWLNHSDAITESWRKEARRDLAAAYAIDAPAIRAEGVAEGRRAAMEEFTGGANFCSAHRERQEGCPVCWPNFSALVAEHRQIAEAKGRAAGRDEALREVVALIRLNASNGDSHGRLVLTMLADAIEAAFPTTGETT